VTAAAVRTAYERGRQAWPGASLDLETFDRRAAELDVRPSDLAGHGHELFLAWACAEEDPVALGYLERHFLQQVDRYLPRPRRSSATIDELRQELRIRLLIGRPPRIGRYNGRGSFGGWVRVTAMRVASNLVELGALSRKAVELGAAGQLADAGMDPELSTITTSHCAVFRAALARTLGALDLRDKELLRLHGIEGMSLDALAARHGIHRSTVARRLASIREQILLGLQQELAFDAKDASELSSLVGMIESDLSAALEELLG
jgi:RNA polymerase sigma-70 factor, ECF subfamily